MKPLHLVGLVGAGGERLRFRPPERAALVLPSLIPLIDQEQILAFYQEVLVDKERLPRIEVDWYRSLLPTDRQYLRTMRDRHGAERYLVVVNVRRPLGEVTIVDLQEVLSQPELEAFEHIAISAVDPLANETLGRLAQLAQLVTEVAQDRYREIAEELDLNHEGFALIQRRVSALLNPVDILGAVNALIDVQIEAGGTGDSIGELSDSDVRTTEAAVVWRMLSRMLEMRPIDEQALLIGLALSKQTEAKILLGTRYNETWKRLRGAQLIRNAALAGWGDWLAESTHVDLMRELVNRVWSQHSEAQSCLASVRQWFAEGMRMEEWSTLHLRVMRLFGFVTSGQRDRTEEEIRALLPLVEQSETPDEVRGNFWDAVGRFNLDVGRVEAGINALKRAMELLRRSSASPVRLSHALGAFARGLRDNGRWAEAEPLFRDALRLAEEGGATPTSRGITMHYLACGLRDNGRWAEAEPLFREALRLAEEGGDTPASRGITVDHLARGLRDNGRWHEAEPLFRVALRLKEEGGDTPTSRGITLHELARGLRDNGRWAEAEPLFREALRLAIENGDTPTSRGITMAHFARGLLDNGRWAEAEPLFRESLKLLQEGGYHPAKRALVVQEFARGLRDNGRVEEAEQLLAGIQGLADADGSKPS